MSSGWADHAPLWRGPARTPAVQAGGRKTTEGRVCRRGGGEGAQLPTRNPVAASTSSSVGKAKAFPQKFRTGTRRLCPLRRSTLERPLKDELREAQNRIVTRPWVLPWWLGSGGGCQAGGGPIPAPGAPV